MTSHAKRDRKLSGSNPTSHTPHNTGGAVPGGCAAAGQRPAHAPLPAPLPAQQAAQPLGRRRPHRGGARPPCCRTPPARPPRSSAHTALPNLPEPKHARIAPQGRGCPACPACRTSMQQLRPGPASSTEGRSRAPPQVAQLHLMLRRVGATAAGATLGSRMALSSAAWLRPGVVMHCPGGARLLLRGAAQRVAPAPGCLADGARAGGLAALTPSPPPPPSTSSPPPLHPDPAPPPPPSTPHPQACCMRSRRWRW
jgi:hypothetical protein